ncbi:MAG TPA: protein kinase [Nitrososphaeraceae archaeon]|nr:protein kinase [Nitrososphaeraceae archaeon]
MQCKLLADYFGMTKDPSSCIMFVMGFYNSGNLYEYLNNTFGVLCWRDIIDILLSISAGIKFIHENNLIHGNLHGGNILIEDDAEMEGIEARISDSGLNVFVNECGLTNKIYGVVPFIAPEIFHGKSLTNKSDIYSFGMIMWMLSAGVRPYNDRAHNESLMHEICQGLRPQVIYGTPQVFAKLMSKCLDDNPLNRPTALQIYDTLDKWDREINEPEDNDLTLQFDSAEEIRFVNFKPSIQINHNDAIYHSRIFEIKLN